MSSPFSVEDTARSVANRRKKTLTILLVVGMMVVSVYAATNHAGSFSSASNVRSKKEAFEKQDVTAASESAPNSQKKDAKSDPKRETETTYLHFPDMVKPSEYEHEIFGSWRNMKADESGWFEKRVHVVGAHDRVLHVEYKGRYAPATHFHNLEADDKLGKFGCTQEDMVLAYPSETDAQSVHNSLAQALASDDVKKVLVTGRQLRRCPKAREPEEFLKSHVFGKEFVPESSKITQSVRQVDAVSVEADDQNKLKWVRLKTSFASLTDVFADLDFSGHTDMFERQSTLRDEKFGLKKKNRDGMSEEEWKRLQEEEYETVPVRHVLDDNAAFEREHQRKLTWGWFKKAVNWVANKVVKPVVKFVKNAVTSVVSFVKSVVGTIIQPLLKLVGSIIPVLVNNQGREAIGREVSLNYDSNSGLAVESWVFDTGSLSHGVHYEIGDQTEVSLLVSGKVVCRNCFIRFYDGGFSWHIKIGGSDLAMLELKMDTKFHAMVELEANIKITTQITQTLGKYPIPMLSIPLGVATIGFEVTGDISLGLEVDVQGLYYKYIVHGYQEFGVRATLLSGVEIIRDGWVNEERVGPVVRDGVKLSAYVLPMVSLVFTSMAALEAGLQPTASFEMKPKATGCEMSWGIQADVKIVVGAWIGYKTAFGMWKLAGFSEGFSLLGGEVTVKTGCLTSSQFAAVQAIAGVTFGNIAIAAAQGDNRASLVSSEEAQFTQAASQVVPRYPTVTAFPEHEEKWVDANGRSCVQTCESVTGYISAASGQHPTTGFHFAVCSADGGDGYRPGWNYDDPNDVNYNRCKIAKNNAAISATSYKCLCKKPAARMAWTYNKGHDCKTTCEGWGFYPIASGNSGTSHVFYVCRANSGGDRAGFNIGPVHATYYDKCAMGFSDREEQFGANNFYCLCMEPKKAPPKPVVWFLEQSTTGCPDVCTRRGYFPVVSGSNAATQQDYVVCSGYYNYKEGWMGVREVNGEMETTACMSHTGTNGVNIHTGLYRCLCTHDDQYIHWYDASHTDCHNVCTSNNRHAIKIRSSGSLYVCSAFSANENAWLGGYSARYGTQCMVGGENGASSMKCACTSHSMF